MATILDTLKKGSEYLQRHGVDEARLNMELLLAHVLKVDRMRLYLDFDKQLSESHLDSLRELTKRRSRGEPVQHLLGTVEFCDLDFLTDARALIPRPETEELAHLLISSTWPEHMRVLDMGCGSGVIGISLAHHLASRGVAVETILCDFSKDALALARENVVRLLSPDARIHLIQSDLFEALEGQSFDLIAANLPYIPSASETALSREVRQDPALALYGGVSGTEVMERFLSSVMPHLRPGGTVAMEFGIDQGEKLAALASDAGLDKVALRKDLSGIERFLFATKSPECC